MQPAGDNPNKTSARLAAVVYTRPGLLHAVLAIQRPVKNLMNAHEGTAFKNYESDPLGGPSLIRRNLAMRISLSESFPSQAPASELPL